MKLLTEKAVLVCKHENGIVENIPSQEFVRIAGLRVLVAEDPEGRKITGCPNSVTPMVACRHTKKVDEGYSTWIRIEKDRVCLDTVTGLTDGIPQIFNYKVRSPGQDFVSEVK
jgi:hypothetical protein